MFSKLLASPQHTPAFVDFPSGIYGAPDFDGRGLKVGLDRRGPPFDPDRDDRIVDAVRALKKLPDLVHRMDEYYPPAGGAPPPPPLPAVTIIEGRRWWGHALAALGGAAVAALGLFLLG